MHNTTTLLNYFYFCCCFSFFDFFYSSLTGDIEKKTLTTSLFYSIQFNFILFCCLYLLRCSLFALFYIFIFSCLQTALAMLRFVVDKEEKKEHQTNILFLFLFLSVLLLTYYIPFLVYLCGASSLYQHTHKQINK